MDEKRPIGPQIWLVCSEGLRKEGQGKVGIMETKRMQQNALFDKLTDRNVKLNRRVTVERQRSLSSCLTLLPCRTESKRVFKNELPKVIVKGSH